MQTNAEGGGTSYVVINAISICFGADASVKAVSYRKGTNLTTWEDRPAGQADSVFRLRIHTVRDAPDDEINKSVCFIEITPLTGLITSFGYEEYNEDGNGKVKAGDLPKQ